MSEQTENLGGKLLSVESIFKWKPVIYEENLNEISCEFEPQSENNFNFYNFIILLVKSYQAAETGNIDSALKTLYDLEVSAKHYTDDFFDKIRFAYYHMVYASKSFLLIKNENYQEATMTVDKIITIDKMDKSNEAAIHAMKSVVFALYSNEDTQKAFASIDKALKLDPENGHWNFFKALILRKLRKMTNPFEVPTLQEKELFQKALDYDPRNVVYKLYLAEVYREISGHAFKRQDNCSHFLPKDTTLTKNLRDNIDEKIRKAEEYFKQAAEEYADSPYVLFRSAEGLARLYPQFDNIKLAKKLTNNGLKKSPDNINGNLVMAFLLEHIDKKYKEAEKHLKKCQAKKIFDADMNMIRFLHSTKSGKFNGIEALDILLGKYQEKRRHAILYCQKVSYFMFVKYDIIKATENAMKFYALNTGSSCMQVHRSCFIWSDEPFPLIDVLNDEVKYIMNGGAKTPKKLRESCEKYIQCINFQNIKVIQGFPQNFRKQILEGKPMIINQNCFQPKKFNQFDKGVKKREINGGRGDGRGKTTNNLSNMPHKPNLDNRRQNNQQPVKPPTDANKLPSLMDTIVCNPSKESEKIPEPDKSEAVIEKVERCLEGNDTKPISKDEQLAKSILKMIQSRREQSENKTRKSYDSDTDLVNDILKELGLDEKKKTGNKKYHSHSETDSEREHRRRKDRRRERSRRRDRSDSYNDSDDSSPYDRRFQQRHKRYSSTDSDHSRSTRYRKSHKKDRYERDYSPRDRRGRRNRKHSSDDECFNLKSSHYRDNSASLERHRRGRKKSVSRSPSYDRRSRRKSSHDLKSKSSKRFDHEYSPYEKKTRLRDNSYDRNSCYKKKSRRRSTSREMSKDDRGKRATNSRPQHDSKEEIGKNKRDQNSTASQSESE